MGIKLFIFIYKTEYIINPEATARPTNHESKIRVCKKESTFVTTKLRNVYCKREVRRRQVHQILLAAQVHCRPRGR